MNLDSKLIIFSTPRESRARGVLDKTAEHIAESQAVAAALPTFSQKRGLVGLIPTVEFSGHVVKF